VIKFARSISAIKKTARLVTAVVRSNQPQLAYVGGWLGKQNLGDEALWYAYEKLFAPRQLLSFDGGFTSEKIIALRSLHGGMMGGGTLIGHKPNSLRLARQFQEGGKPLIIFGTGVEEPRFWPDAVPLSEWKPVLDKCPFVGVRGPISARMLQAAGIERVQIVGDPVLAYAQTAINENSAPNTVGLNIGISDGRLWGDEKTVAVNVSSLARKARLAGWTVHWFVVWPKDLAMTQEAARESGTDAHIHTVYTDPLLFMSKVRELSTFVGMKLHATVLATCVNTPAIMLEYRPKCRDYMESIEQGDSTIRTDKISPDAIWETINTWNNQRHRVASDLASCMVRARSRQQEWVIQATPHLLSATP